MMQFMARFILLLLPMASYADLVAMSDDEMESSQGAGLGFALEDFVLSSDNSSLVLTGINDSNGDPTTTDWTELYIMGEGSENGTIRTPVDIASYNHPWILQTVRGSTDWDNNPGTYNEGDYPAISDDKSLFELATNSYETTAQNTQKYVENCIFSTSPDCTFHTSVRRTGMDIGSKFALQTVDRLEYLDIDLKGVYIDGSYVHTWSEYDDANESELNSEFKITFYARELNIGACDSGCSPELSVVNIDDFYLNIWLGYGQIQPVRYSVTSDGNFQLEMGWPDASPTGINMNSDEEEQEFFNGYYSNVPRIDAYFGNISVGDTSIGSTRIDGLTVQYLKVTSIDL